MDAQCNVIWLMVLGTITDKCVLYKLISWHYCSEDCFTFPASGELGM